MTVSYINLMRVQQRPISAFPVSVPTMASTDQLHAQAKAARDRLMRGKLTAVVLEPRPNEVQLVEPTAPASYGPAPLNMLSAPSWRFLLALACVRFGVTAKEVLGPCRRKVVVSARYEAMALIYQHTQQSFPGVGRLLHRDHTTVLHGVNKLGRNSKLVDLLTAAETARRSKSIPVAAKPRPQSAPPKRMSRAQRVAFTRKAIRDGYEAGKCPRDIAAIVGMTPGSVKVVASGMGLRRPAESIQGMSIPLHLVEDYRTLRKNEAYSRAEALRILGIES